MKNKGFLLVMAVCTLVTQTLCILPFSVGHQYFQWNQVSFDRVSRQAAPLECAHVFFNTQCSTIMDQRSIDQLSKCGTDGLEVVREFEQNCRINEAGERCGLIDKSNIVESTCKSSTTCSTECHNSLTESVMKYGCCNSDFTNLQRYFSLCGVDVPLPCPPTSLNIPSSPPINLSCSTEDMSTELFCSLSGLATAIEVLNSNNCQSFARDLEIICSMRDGEFCTDQFGRNISDLSNAVQYCPSTSSCPPMCQAAINTINNNRGCCFNFYNTTFVNGTAFYLNGLPFANISGNSLWEACGVIPPGACPAFAISAAGNNVFSVLAVISLVICTVYFV